MSINVNSSYLAVIRDSVGSHMFRHLFVNTDDGTSTDIIKNGRLGCAYYVAFILYHFKLIKEPHAVVASTVNDMEASGWRVVETPEIGDVLVWEPSAEHLDDELHEHIGFYMGEGRAISNSSALGEIVEHDLAFRRVTKILRRPMSS